MLVDTNFPQAPQNVKETIAWLLRLGRPPLPECPLEAAKQGRTQKQPQFFDGKRVVPVNWQEWQKQQPIPEIYEAWFRHPKTGIGTLGGWNGRHWLGWVDFDADDFENPEAMQTAIANWFAQYPAIVKAPQFKSPSGGYRVLLAFEKEPDTGANNGFSLFPNAEKRMGELLIKNGGHTLLPPTMGANGKLYQWLEWSEYPPIFPTIENAGLYPVKDAKQAERKNTAERSFRQRSTNFIGQSLTEVLEREIYPHLTADRLFGDLEDWKGTEKNCWCPFCTTREKAPSFNVPSDKTTFLCYGCRVTGSWADYIVLRDRVEFKEAVIKLGAMVGVEIPSYTHAQNAQCNNKYQHQYADASNKGFGEPQKKKLPLKDAAAKARVIMGQKLPELEENLVLEEIRSECGMSSYDWTTKIIKPLKRDLEGERFKLELKGLLAIEDAIERLRQQALIAPRYSMNSATLEKALQIMKVKQGTPETRVWSLDDFLDQTSEGLNWLIPGFLPKGETILLIGAPKSGKSLLAVDVAFAVATGDEFLGVACTEGRVLIISVDESANSTKNKLLRRGFRRQDATNVRVIDKWDISQLSTLEAVMEDFRPSLVIVDSLKRITHGSEVSENSAEFADNIYALKEIFTRYSASGILVHHAKKDKDAYGVDMARGSSAIAGATWGQWQIKQIPKPDPDNPKRLIVDPSDPERSFYVHSRDIEGEVLTLHFNPDNNSYENLGGKEMGSKEEELHRGAQESLIRDRIMRVLRLNDPTPLSGRQIIELMECTKEEGRSVYTTLGRMVGKRIISSFPAPGDKRYNLYSLPHPTKDSSNNTLPENRGFSTPPPSPPPTISTVDYSAENYTPTDLGDTQQLVNNYTTDSQHPFSAEIETSCTVSVWSDSKLDNTSTQRGGEGGKNPPDVAVECDSKCETNQPDDGDWTIVGALATTSINEGDAIVGLAPLGLDGIAPTPEDLAMLTMNMLTAVTDNDLDLFNTLRELYPIRWLQQSAHQIRLNNSTEFETIFGWLKAPAALRADSSDVLVGAGAFNFPGVGDLVWRSPVPADAKAKQRKPAQPGCVCRIVQVSNNGAIALCESDGSQFHVSWHAWQSGLFVPYCGQDGR